MNALIPFNRPYMTGRELHYVSQAHQRGHLSGDGAFTAACSQWLEERTGASRALLTHSCTAALEMAALLLDLRPGDEVIMPSYTFVSTANAFALRGAVPVFVDIRADTLNLDERLIEGAITERTRAICVVHYAGVAADMDAVCAVAERYGLVVVEDAAQALMSTHRGRPLGTIGDFGTLSFHETKNIISGEGGALLCRADTAVENAEIIREKGTNRRKFARGDVDKYSWVGLGSSFLPGEITAAFLWAQMAEADTITARRRAIWARYYEAFAPFEAAGVCRRPVVPREAQHNGHMFYLLLRSEADRDAFISGMAERGVMTVFHYVPLHSSPAGSNLGRPGGDLTVTDDVSSRLVRLPLWLGLEESLDDVIAAAREVLAELPPESIPLRPGLRLERLTSRHGESLRLLRNKPTVRPGFRDDSEISADQQRAWVASATARSDEATWVMLDADDQVRGSVALCYIDHTERDAECARLMVDPDYPAAKGSGVELIHASAALASGMGLTSMWGLVKGGNAASRRALARAGFVEGDERQEEGMRFVRLRFPPPGATRR